MHAIHTYSAFRLTHLQCSVAIQAVAAAVAEQVVGVLAAMLVPMLEELVRVAAAYWWRRPTFAWPLACKHSMHRTDPISYVVYLHIRRLL